MNQAEPLLHRMDGVSDMAWKLSDQSLSVSDVAFSTDFPLVPACVGINSATNNATFMKCPPFRYEIRDGAETTDRCLVPDKRRRWNREKKENSSKSPDSSILKRRFSPWRSAPLH